MSIMFGHMPNLALKKKISGPLLPLTFVSLLKYVPSVNGVNKWANMSLTMLMCPSNVANFVDVCVTLIKFDHMNLDLKP